MRCNQATEALWTFAPGEQPSSELSQHLEQCAACAAILAERQQLDSLLDTFAADEPGPGFDTRFFARLREEQAKGQRSKWSWFGVGGAAVAAAAAAMVAVWLPATPATMTEDAAMMAHLEMLEDMRLIEKLDEIEAYAMLADVDLGELGAGSKGAQPWQ